MADLKDKVAIVTGAARGIGQAIAVKLASCGANVVLCDLKEEWLKETVALVKEQGVEVLTYSVNVIDGEAVKEVVADVVKTCGKIDILVNNAGITKDTLISRMTEENWDAVLDVNLKGTFLFTKAVARPMMKQRCGAIVNIASIIGLIGNAGQANYAASKGGVIALTKSVAKELASRNVRANAVAPGFIDTAMTNDLPEDVKNQMMTAIPMKKLGQPEDIANVVAFLAGSDSSYMTGQVLTVSGGMVM